MKQMKKFMHKDEFVAMIAELIGEHMRPEYRNETYGIGLRDFRNWEPWFTYGEWNHGPRWIFVDRTERNIAFLRKWGFTRV